MMNDMKVYPIGKIENKNNQIKIILDPTYKKGLKGLSGYSHAKPVVHTPRLCLRPMHEGDLPALREWMPDPSIYTY